MAYQRPSFLCKVWDVDYGTQNIAFAPPAMKRRGYDCSAHWGPYSLPILAHSKIAASPKNEKHVDDEGDEYHSARNRTTQWRPEEDKEGGGGREGRGVGEGEGGARERRARMKRGRRPAPRSSRGRGATVRQAVYPGRSLKQVQRVGGAHAAKMRVMSKPRERVDHSSGREQGKGRESDRRSSRPGAQSSRRSS